MSPAHRILLQEDSRLQRNSPVHLENNNRYVSLSVYLSVCLIYLSVCLSYLNIYLSVNLPSMFKEIVLFIWKIVMGMLACQYSF